jgi:23S rRNA-/tRNA-specific pseudouridylate synthase
MEIVFQNHAVLVANKAAGTLTVPSRIGAADPRPCLGRLLETAIRGRLWPVHRLDFEVSGLVLFAKNADAHRIASQAWEGRRVAKLYEALTEPEGKDPEGKAKDKLALPAAFRWESLLVRGMKRTFEAPHGQRAVTVARAVGRVPATTVLAGAEGEPPELLRWELEPETGRAHQLRVHLVRAGFPVAGDTLYGAVTTLRQPQAIALRAVRLELTEAADRQALGLPAVLEVASLTSAPPRT